MRYLKPFLEKKIDEESIESEINEISYILEDEGYIVEFGIANAHVHSINSNPVLWMQIRNVFDVEKLRKSDEFNEFLDRLSEILDKFKVNKMETLGSKKRKEIGRYYDYSLDEDGIKKYLLLNYIFNKKHLKPFYESKSPDYSEIDKIIEELETISHILVDGGYDVNIERMNFKLNQHQLPSKLELFDIGIIIDISPKIIGDNAMDVTSEEYYDEWKDRLYDICREFNMHVPAIYPQVNRVRAMIATKRRIQLENPDYLIESKKTTCEWITNLYKEVKEISYILEDEGILINYDYNDEVYSRAPLYLEIALNSKNKIDQKDDYFIEYMDRLEEIVEKYISTFDFKKVYNPIFKDGFYTQRIMLYLE